MQYLASTGKASSVGFNANMQAFLVANQTLLGTGIISGLVVDGSGNLTAGTAYIGILASYSGGNVASLLGYTSTNYVYLALSPAPSIPSPNGIDTGVVVVNQTGYAPVNGILICTITTTAGAITGHTNAGAIDNTPTKRNNFQVPLALNEFEWLGAYNGSTAYALNGSVSYNGSTFICVNPTTGNAPSAATPPVNNTWWNVIAQQGASGPSYTPPTFGPQAITGTQNGTNVTFAIANAPASGWEYTLFKNGIMQIPGSGNAYQISGTTITMTVPPSSSDTLYFVCYH